MSECVYVYKLKLLKIFLLAPYLKASKPRLSKRFNCLLQKASFLVSQPTLYISVYISISVSISLDFNFSFILFLLICIHILLLFLGTVLDGELVYNISFKRTVFLIFDVISIDEKTLTKLPFEKRLDALNTEIMNRCSMIQTLFLQYQKSNPNTNTSSATSTYPLEIIRKQYYKKPDINQLISKIQYQQTHYVYYNTDRRHHLMDGLIFQPNKTYVFGNDFQLLKWKFINLRSIDVQVLYDVGKESLSLFCSGPDGVLIDISKRNSDNCIFGAFDKYRLLCDYYNNYLNVVTGNTKIPFIVEVSYDTQIGLWKYLKYRSDKDEPNYIDTVIGVMLEQAENISLDEIKNLSHCNR